MKVFSTAATLFVMVALMSAPLLAPSNAEAAGRGLWLPQATRHYAPPCINGASRLDLAPDGIFKCASLPARVTFPMGFDLRVVESPLSATILTVDTGGALAFHYTITTWRPSDPGINRTIDDGQEDLLRQLTIVQNIKILSHEAIELPGFPPGRKVRFTDGQNYVRGEMHTFILPGWGLSMISIGHDEALLRPQGAMAQAFFKSMQSVQTSTPKPLKITTSIELKLPPGAYRVDSPKSRVWTYLIPNSLAHSTIVDAGSIPDCKKALEQTKKPGALQQLIKMRNARSTFSKAQTVDAQTNSYQGRHHALDGSGVLEAVGLIHCTSENNLLLLQVSGQSSVGDLKSLLGVLGASL